MSFLVWFGLVWLGGSALYCVKEARGVGSLDLDDGGGGFVWALQMSCLVKDVT